MLRHLHIRNLALIEDLAVDFAPGFTVITGETGAGKSIVLDAIALLAGKRAAPSLVRAASERATVEAVFELAADSPLAKLLPEWGLDEPGGELILRREVLASGRSRASVNGRLVPAGQLAEVASRVIEMHAQGEQHALLEPEVQRDMFDDFANLAEAKARLASAYQAVLEAQRAHEALAREDGMREQRIDFLKFQVGEIEGLAPQAGESARLEAERKRLLHLEDLMARGARAGALLLDGGDDAPPAIALAGSALEELEAMARHDSALQPILDALYDAKARLEDAAHDLQRYTGALEAEPERLREVDDRLDALKKVLRKHGPAEQDALCRADEMREELAKLENWESAREQAAQTLQERRRELRRAAWDLRTFRERARPGIVRPLAGIVREFAMPKARIDVDFAPLAAGIDLGEGLLCGPHGAEQVQIMFSANEGEPLQPLHRVASGGELGRIMLALRTMGANNATGMLFVFDEIDAGISGAAARRVAERLAALGERHQVLCVTHNPPLAAAAHHHFVVEKSESNGRTRTELRRADGTHRRAELARLLDGGQQSDKGLALADELLKQAG